MNAQTVQRPHYTVTSLKAAQAWHWCGWHLSEKMDGVFALREFAGCVVTGEAMRDGRFFAFDILVAFGQDVRRQPWTQRSAALDELFSRLNPKLNWHRCATGVGAEFVEAVLASGGEGVVCKPWAAPFGVAWRKIKRQETFDCVVVERDIARGSIRLELDRQDCGWCPARAAFDLIRVGDVVEVAAYGRHASGKFREARFKRIRLDKTGEVR
jgi:ATP-dependent DNA ligase